MRAMTDTPFVDLRHGRDDRRHRRRSAGRNRAALLQPQLRAFLLALSTRPTTPTAARSVPRVTVTDARRLHRLPDLHDLPRHGAATLQVHGARPHRAACFPIRPSLPICPRQGGHTLTQQQQPGRHILHLLYGAPQVRGKAVPNAERVAYRVMEMIEDIPALGPVSASVRLAVVPSARL